MSADRGLLHAALVPGREGQEVHISIAGTFHCSLVSVNCESALEAAASALDAAIGRQLPWSRRSNLVAVTDSLGVVEPANLIHPNLEHNTQYQIVEVAGVPSVTLARRRPVLRRAQPVERKPVLPQPGNNNRTS